MTDKEFTILEPEPDLFFKLFAAFSATTYIALCYYFITNTTDVIQASMLLTFLGFIVLKHFVIAQISRQVIHFSFSENMIKYELDIGIFTWKKKWRPLPEVKYVSIYAEDAGYNIILWHEGNDFLNLFSMPNYNEVIKQGISLSDNFKVKFLDATIKDDENHWVDKSHYKDTGKVKYLD